VRSALLVTAGNAPRRVAGNTLIYCIAPWFNHVLLRCVACLRQALEPVMARLSRSEGVVIAAVNHPVEQLAERTSASQRNRAIWIKRFERQVCWHTESGAQETSTPA
jgi:hypothetical protein